MSQNSISNKISSFIGIILLLLIIGFTVFINFFSQESGVELKEEEEEVKEYLVLDSTVLSDLWKLENLRVKINHYEHRKQTFMSVEKILGTINSKSLLNNPIFSDMPDSLKQMVEDVYVDSPKSEGVVKYGILAFKHADQTNEDDMILLESFKASSPNSVQSDSIELVEIGNVILNYQIQSIETQPEKGNFTQIRLQDGRKVILIKNDPEIIDKFYKQIIKQASYLNDSTKLLLPKL